MIFQLTVTWKTRTCLSFRWTWLPWTSTKPWRKKSWSTLAGWKWDHLSFHLLVRSRGKRRQMKRNRFLFSDWCLGKQRWKISKSSRNWHQCRSGSGTDGHQHSVCALVDKVCSAEHVGAKEGTRCRDKFHCWENRYRLFQNRCNALDIKSTCKAHQRRHATCF